MADERRDATSAPTAWRVLEVVSCCTALAAFSLVYVSIRLTGEMLAANPTCATPALQIIADIHTSLLAGGAAGVLSWLCVFFAHRSASGSTRGAQRTTSTLLVLSSIALVGLVFSVGWYEIVSWAGRVCVGLRLLDLIRSTLTV